MTAIRFQITLSFLQEHLASLNDIHSPWLCSQGAVTMLTILQHLAVQMPTLNYKLHRVEILHLNSTALKPNVRHSSALLSGIVAGIQARKRRRGCTGLVEHAKVKELVAKKPLNYCF